MKKFIAIAVVGVFGVLALGSCKKDYKCECKIEGMTYTYDLKDVKKKDAKDACNSVGNAWILQGGTCDFK